MKDPAGKSIKNRPSWIASCLGIVILSACFLAASAVKADAVAETGREDYGITAGITESTVYVTDSDEKNVRVHILRIGKEADVSFKVTCKDYYTEGSTAKTRSAAASDWGADDWGYQKLKDLASAYESAGDPEGEVIAASNGDFFNKETGSPLGMLVIEGNVLNNAQTEPFFAVLKDGRRVIRNSSGDISDVEEAVAGRHYLVKDGLNVINRNDDPFSEPRQAIGICEDGTVVILNADGREPASLGLTIYDLAEVALQQGCTDAINLDGGGSATFLTKRPGDEELIYRNVPGDGFERNVTGSLLIVKNKNDEENFSEQDISAVPMKVSGTALEEKDGEYSYCIDGDPAEGFQVINGNSYLFDEDGHGITKSVEIADTEYKFSGGMLTECSDEDAGTVIIGYCGAEEDGENLLYAYQKGDDTLNVGLNPLDDDADGSMTDWTHDTMRLMPWYSLRSDVKSVNIGEGVTDIGDRFLFVFKGKVFDGTVTPECMLETLSLPESLKTIGEMAFYNKPNLKNLILPSKINKIGKNAFAGAGTGFIMFTGDKPPKLGKSAIDATAFDVLFVPETEEWNEYLESDASETGIEGMENICLRGTVPPLGTMIVFDR